MTPQPPRFARFILSSATPRTLRDTVVRDLDEVFERKCAEGGPDHAARWYRREALACARGFLRDRLRIGRDGSLRVSSVDLKLAGRMLRKSPGLTIVGGLAIATAIGVTVVAFEIVNDVIRPVLPLPNSDRVVTVQWINPRTTAPDPRLSYELWQWRGARAITAVGGYLSLDSTLVTSSGTGELIHAARMTASGFDVAGVAPMMGRVLTAADEQPGAPAVAVISHRIWSEQLNSDPNAIGRVVHLGRTPYTVVGVMPQGFGFPVAHTMWIPLDSVNALTPRFGGPPLRAFARLRPGVSEASAASELQHLSGREPIVDPSLQDLTVRVMPYARGLMPQRTLSLTSQWQALLVVILMVCAANVATLIFARTAQRQTEIAVRTALGASRARILLQFFLEALALAVAGAVASMTFVTVSISWVMQRIWSAGTPRPFWWDDRIAPMSYAYAAALTLLIALICGIAPALKGTRRRVAGTLQQDSRSATLRFGGAWTTIIVVQVALMVALLPPALLQSWTAVRVQRAGTGFATDEFLSARVGVEPEAADRQEALFHDLAERLAREPRVEGVTFASQFPGTSHGTVPVTVDGIAPGDRYQGPTFAATVAPNFFSVLGVRLVAGRNFVDGDAQNGLVAIVNEQFVADVLAGANPLGRHIRSLSGSADDPSLEIIGVVPDLGFNPFRPENGAGFYRVARPGTKGVNAVALHTAGEPGAFAPRLRAAVIDVSPEFQLSTPVSLDLIGEPEQVALRMFSFGLFFVAVMGVILSTAGIYSMMSFTVSRRTREIAIRAALGADARRVILDIFTRAALQVGLGAAAGVALVVYWRPEFAREPWLPIGLAGFMAVIGTFACAAPARRALRIAPSDALKAE